MSISRRELSMRWRRNLRDNPSGEERKRPFRRPGWAWLFLLLLPVLWTAFALGHAVFLETDRLRPVRKSVVLPGLPDAFDGFRIAVMSDFHLTTGRRDRSLLQRAVELSGSILALYAALPLVSAVLELLEDMLGG